MGRGRPRKKKSILTYPSARVHHMTVWLRDKDGNIINPEGKIKEVIEKHRGGFTTVAYILHDADTYSAEEVYEREEKNQKCFVDRYTVLSEVADLERVDGTTTGYAEDEKLAEKAHEYADEIFPRISEGQPKPPHWHIVLTFDVNRKVDEIARWFGVDPNWNERKLGRSAAENAWMYLIHSNATEKAPYAPEDVHANFDYVNDVKSMIEKARRHEKYASVSEYDIDDALIDIAQGTSLYDIQDRLGPNIFAKRKNVFQNARTLYLSRYAQMPTYREVFYVEAEGIDEDKGKGGVGKSFCAKAFCRQLAMEFGADENLDINNMGRYVFTAGDATVFFQSYDGQPILLVNEITGTDFKRALKGVQGVKSLLDPFPERKEFNIKHGSTLCLAKYIVINGIQSFEKFKRELAGEMVIDGTKQESETQVKEQFDRRFWGKITIRDKNVKTDYVVRLLPYSTHLIEFWANRGLFEGIKNSENLMSLIGFRQVDFSTIGEVTAGKARFALEQRLLTPMLDEVEKSKDHHAVENKITDPNDLPAYLLEMVGETELVFKDKVIDTVIVEDQLQMDDFEELTDEDDSLPF